MGAVQRQEEEVKEVHKLSDRQVSPNMGNV